MRRYGMIVQWAGEADVVQNIFGCVFWVVSVFAVRGNAIAINEIEEGHDGGAEFFSQLGIMIISAADAGKAFKKITVWNGPFAAALAAKNAEDFASII